MRKKINITIKKGKIYISSVLLPILIMPSYGQKKLNLHLFTTLRTLLIFKSFQNICSSNMVVSGTWLCRNEKPRSEKSF